MKWDALRWGQADAIKLALQRFVMGEPYTALVLPCRYGKSDVIRLIAYLLWLDGYCSCTLAMSPNVVLRNQLGDTKRWNEAFQRYGIDGTGVKKRTLEVAEWRPNAQGEMFLSTTIQSVQRNLDNYKDWVRHVIQSTGKPPLVAVDEGHTGSEDNDWGDTFGELVDAGARGLVTTATAMRADGRQIRGLSYELISQQDEIYYTTRKHEDPAWIWVQQRNSSLRRVKVIPDNNDPPVGFRDAWKEDCLCKVNRIPFDVDLTLMEGTDGRWRGKLSQLESREEVHRALGLLKDMRAVRGGVESFVAQLTQRRQELPDAAGIVFVGNDDIGEDAVVNKYANQVAALIRRLVPDWVVVVATSADDSGKDRLIAFSEEGGRGDVLVVKQMAGLGLDVPRLKVVLDLSPIRTPVAWIQRVLRAATPYRSSLVMDLIGPDDLLSREAFDVMIDGQGGSVGREDLGLIDEWAKPKEEEPPRYWAFDGMAGAPFDDNDRNWAEHARWQMVQDLLRAIPGLSNHYTAAFMATRLSDLPWKRDPEAAALLLPGVEDTGPDAERLRWEINALAVDIATTLRRFPQWEGQTFGDVISTVYTAAYRAAGVPIGVELKRVGDQEMLKRVKGALIARLVQLGRKPREAI